MWVEKVLMWTLQALGTFYVIGIVVAIVDELWSDVQECRENERERRKQLELIELEERRRREEHAERLRANHASDRRWPEDGSHHEG